MTNVLQSSVHMPVVGTGHRTSSIV